MSILSYNLSLAGKAVVWFLQQLPPETAHQAALTLLDVKMLLSRFCQRHNPPLSEKEDPILAVRLWKRNFSNPVGLAAGFDKNAKYIDSLFKLGFGFIEVGTVTLHPQTGNPQPRLFRLLEDQALINRMGFNNDGLDSVIYNLLQGRKLSSESTAQLVVGINLGKNRDSTHIIDDYICCTSAVVPLVDYIVINVSSPNTPGLQSLQKRDTLSYLIREVQWAIKREAQRIQCELPPLLVKISPDLTFREQADIAEITLDNHLDGLVITNTTITRPSGLHVCLYKEETGGLSGKPLFPTSTQILANLYRLTDGQVPIIGVGGIASGADALAKIKAGASLVQIYTAMIYDGPSVVKQIKRELARLLRIEGYRTVAEAVGVSVR